MGGHHRRNAGWILSHCSGIARMLRVALFCLLTAFAPLALAFEISPEDRAWLDELGVVRFSYDPEFAPFEIIGPDGQFRGVAADFLDWVGDKLGITFERVPQASWPDSIAAIQRGEIDLLPCLGHTLEREAYLDFTEPYLEFVRVAVSRRDTEYRDLTELDEQRIAVQRDSSHHGYIRAKTDFNPTLFDSFREAMLAVAAGEMDAVIGNLATVTHTMQNLSLANLRVMRRIGTESLPLHMGVRKDLERLVPLLNKALDAMPLERRYAILDFWIPLPLEADPGLHLTREEREWLMVNPRIRLGWDPAWAPIEFKGADGRPQGFSVDLLRQIEAKLGIRFIFEPPRPWSETIKLLKRREIDVVSCVGFSEDRAEDILLTQSYLSAPVVIYARKDHPYIRNLASLQGATVAIPAGYIESFWLARDYPGINQLLVSSVEEALSAVRAGEAEAFVGSVMQGNYYLTAMRDWSLSIAGETEYENTLHIGVRSDWPLLVEILNKAIRAIPEEEQAAVYRKWVWIDYRQPIDYWPLLRIVLIGSAILLTIFWWNRRLAREVRLRTAAEQRVTQSEADLRKSYLDLRESERQRENLMHMIVHDLRSPLTIIVNVFDLVKNDLAKVDCDREVAERIGDAIDLSRGSVQEMSRIVDALLDISRLEDGKMPVEKSKASILDVATGVAEIYTLMAAQFGVKVSIHGADAACAFDIHLIKRVFSNLLSNAIKACSPGDQIVISIADQTDSARVEVKDTGRGIAPQYHDLIFDKFTQVGDEGNLPVCASSGVGLAFCKLAIEQHKGRIGMQSEEGQGSLFWFELPKE